MMAFAQGDTLMVILGAICLASFGQGHNPNIDLAIKSSKGLGAKMNIAVVDLGGNLVAFARMDGAWLGSVDIAIKKAKTSTFFSMDSGKIGKLSQPGGPLYNIEVSNGGLISFPGGVPLKDTAAVF